MTKEELKQRYSMKEIVEQYGFRPNRAGFIRCPFHTGDRDASLKIYEKDFHCFGCGANGDIFDFVQGMDGVSFREAFLSLGGTYRQEKPGSFSQRMARYRREKAKEQRKKEQHRISNVWNSISEKKKASISREKKRIAEKHKRQPNRIAPGK